jgi:hypothetical protein
MSSLHANTNEMTMRGQVGIANSIGVEKLDLHSDYTCRAQQDGGLALGAWAMFSPLRARGQAGSAGWSGMRIVIGMPVSARHPGELKPQAPTLMHDALIDAP